MGRRGRARVGFRVGVPDISRVMEAVVAVWAAERKGRWEMLVVLAMAPFLMLLVM